MDNPLDTSDSGIDDSDEEEEQQQEIIPAAQVIQEADAPQPYIGNLPDIADEILLEFERLADNEPQPLQHPQNFSPEEIADRRRQVLEMLAVRLNLIRLQCNLVLERDIHLGPNDRDYRDRVVLRYHDRSNMATELHNRLEDLARYSDDQAIRLFESMEPRHQEINDYRDDLEIRVFMENMRHIRD